MNSSVLANAVSKIAAFRLIGCTSRLAFKMLRHTAVKPRVLLPLAGCMVIAGCQPMYSLELKGEWRLQTIHTTSTATLSTEETLRWRDYRADFADRKISFAGRDCLNPNISSDWQQLGVVANRIGMNVDIFALNHETPVQLLHIDCENDARFAFGSEIIRIDEKRLIMAHEGVMFEFQLH